MAQSEAARVCEAGFAVNFTLICEPRARKRRPKEYDLLEVAEKWLETRCEGRVKVFKMRQSGSEGD
jgi:hypothetical protein